MTALLETARGVSASAAWVLGTPFVNARAAYFTQDKAAARKVVVAHCQRFLDTCRITVEMDGPLPAPGRGAVLCHNETSFADLMAYMASAYHHADYVAVADIYRVFPFARAGCERIGFQMLRRGNRASSDALMARMVTRLRAGNTVAWSGEGRLAGIDGVRRFKVGAGLIAIRAGVPVIPVALHGGHRLMPLGSLRARPGTIRVRFGAPVDTTQLTEDDARAFADRLQGTVADMYATLARSSAQGASSLGA